MELPENLYHFSSFESGLKLLKSSRLLLSSFGNFNDPFEFLPQTKYSSNLLSRCAWKIRALISNLEKRAADEIFFMPDTNCLKHYVCFLEEVRLACFSETYDNLLMWGHYARKHTGIVLSFKTGIQNWGGNNFFPVSYTNKRRDIEHPDEQAGHSALGEKWKTDLFCSKSLCWSYEKEWRFIKYKEHCAYDKATGCYYESIRSGAIDAVILGCQISEQNKKLLIDYCKNNIPEIDVFQASPDRYNYELVYERIY